jgi:hypothetical protein
MRKAAGVSGHQRPFAFYETSAMDLKGVETQILYLEQNAGTRRRDASRERADRGKSVRSRRRYVVVAERAQFVVDIDALGARDRVDACRLCSP